jgi:hypothetical protein
MNTSHTGKSEVGHSFAQMVDPLADTLSLFGGKGYKEKLSFKQIQVLLHVMAGDTTMTSVYQQEYLEDLGRVTSQIRILQKQHFIQHIGNGRYRASVLARAWFRTFRDSPDYPQFLRWVEIARQRRADRPPDSRRPTPFDELNRERQAEQDRVSRTLEEHRRMIDAYHGFTAAIEEQERLRRGRRWMDRPVAGSGPPAAVDIAFEQMISRYRELAPLWAEARERAARRLSKVQADQIKGPQTRASTVLGTVISRYHSHKYNLEHFLRDAPMMRDLFRLCREPQVLLEVIAVLDGLRIEHPYVTPRIGSAVSPRTRSAAPS